MSDYLMTIAIGREQSQKVVKMNVTASDIQLSVEDFLTRYMEPAIHVLLQEAANIP